MWLLHTGNPQIAFSAVLFETVPGEGALNPLFSIEVLMPCDLSVDIANYLKLLNKQLPKG